MFNRIITWRLVQWLPLITIPITQLAFADEFDTVNFIGLRSLRYETNLFKLSTSANDHVLLNGRTKSDEITTTTAGINFNKKYSLQKFELDVSYVDYDYKKFSYLSFGGINYSGQWNWQLTPSLYGSIIAIHKEQQASYLDYQGIGNRNITTVEIKKLDTTFKLDGAWKFLTKLTELEVNNERLIVQESDFNLREVEIGFQRDFRSGSVLSFLKSQSRGNFFKRSEPSENLLIDTGFKESRNELRALWSITERSTIDARLAYVNRTHDNFSQRNFSGSVGGVIWHWEPTAKLELVSSWQQTVNSYQSNNSSFIKSNIISIGPDWHTTVKTLLKARYEYRQRQFLGQGFQIPLLPQQDSIQSAQLALIWNPLRELTLNASIQKDKRISNLIGKNFESSTAIVSARIEF